VTTQTNNRTDLITRLEAEQTALQAVLRDLPEERMGETLLGVWSLGDVLTHIATWYELATRDSERAIHGRTPALATFQPGRGPRPT